MDKNKKHLFQLSQRDISEIADVANLSNGDGIELTRTEKGITISIDKQALRMWVQAIIQGRDI